jgi:hypothetical protein
VQICRDFYTAALAHRAEGQSLLEGQAQDSENSRRMLGETQRLKFSTKGGAKFEATVDLDKKKVIKVMSPPA